MGRVFALWMFIILVVMAIATFMLRRHPIEPGPVVPLHNDGGRSAAGHFEFNHNSEQLSRG